MKTVVLLVVILLVPAWLYATGNTPYKPYCNEILLRKVNQTFPNLPESTFVISHRIYNTIRKMGLNVPYSRNEKFIYIFNTYLRSIEICDQVLSTGV